MEIINLLSQVIEVTGRIHQIKVKDWIHVYSLRWANKLPFKATVILIGSYARGDFNLWSDVDILLISESLSGNPIERLKALDAPQDFKLSH